MKHNPNGRFVVVCGDGEYIIYTALAWRNRSFGSALEFVWSSEGEYAIRESTSRIKIFNKSFQVHGLLNYYFELLSQIQVSHSSIITSALPLVLASANMHPVPLQITALLFILSFH